MIKISAVVTVYNKSIFLPKTIESLLAQTISEEMEYVFVDDASTDNSVEIIQEYANSNPNIKIIRNTKNLGPSIRLNQGVEFAKGKYLLLMDGDDLLFENAAELLLNILTKEKADFIYGKRLKLLPEQQLSNICNPKYATTTSPLNYILSHRKLVNMASLVKRDLFIKAHGADELVFIQDESLPLRLALKAKKFIDLKTEIVGVPPQGTKNTYKRLSKNSNQQYHDRFMTYYNFFAENQLLSSTIKGLVKKRCIATFWKYRCSLGHNITNFKYFYFYCLSRIFPNLITRKTLNQIRDEFLTIKAIRRM